MNKVPKKQRYKGVLVKISGNKTVKVQVEFSYPHPIYKKIVKSHRNFLCHVEDVSLYKIGQVVEIESCIKISKKKAFKLID